MASVTLRKVHKSFGRQEAIRSVDLDIEDGAFVVLVGPSGCGKSTLLRLIAGLEDLTSGALHINGESVDHLPPAKRGIAMVFQSYALYPHMSAYDNMAFGMKLAKADRAEIDRRVRAAADTLELTPLLDRLPKALSGGQRQRVAIGRAIVRDPKVFLFDEPLSNLDASLRTQMRAEIARLHDTLKTTIIYVTHDQVEAMTLADQIAVMRDGCIEQMGPPLALYARPETQFVAGFIGAPQMNFLDVRVQTGAHGSNWIVQPGHDGPELTVPRLETSVAPATSRMAVLGIRPEHLSLTDGPGMPAKIDLVENLGEAHHLHVVLADKARMIVKRAGAAEARQGDDVTLSLDAAPLHLFAANGTAIGRRA